MHSQTRAGTVYRTCAAPTVEEERYVPRDGVVIEPRYSPLGPALQFDSVQSKADGVL